MSFGGLFDSAMQMQMQMQMQMLPYAGPGAATRYTPAPPPPPPSPATAALSLALVLLASNLLYICMLCYATLRYSLSPNRLIPSTPSLFLIPFYYSLLFI
jgi:hypothetical protein